jgi:hypothetical protein
MQPHLLLTVLCCHSTYDSKLGTHHVQSPSGPSINDPRLCMYPTLSKHEYLLTRQEIVTRADLNTLCITSKAYHAYVIPRLYERVYLRIWNRDEVLRFIGCVSAGASPNLRHTRTLVVEDRRILEWPSSLLVGPLAIPFYREVGPDEEEPEERDHHMSTILSLFPRNVLHRLWYTFWTVVLAIDGELTSLQLHSRP